MIQKPMDVLQAYPIRKYKQQKAAFREDVRSYAENLGYSVSVEEGKFGAQNLIIGDAGSATYLVTAHYDTPSSIGIPNFLTPCNPVTFLLFQTLVIGFFVAVAFGVGYLTSLVTNVERIIFSAGYIAYFALLLLMMFGPANRHNANDNTSGVVTALELASRLTADQRKNVAFILFDLEEAGLIGSSSYRKAHKAQTENQIVLNLDCVGDGEHFMLFPMKKAKKNDSLMQQLRGICTTEGERTITLREKGFAHGSSDHKNFPNGVGIMAFHKAKLVGLYCDRIHTWRDKILDETNVSAISDALITLITADNQL